MDGGAERGRDLAEEDAILASRSLREIAVDIYDREQVDADSWMRAKPRRLLCRAEARAGAGPGTE